MLIIPAIDLKDGQCVRLEQGRMDSATVFSNEPAKAEGSGAFGMRRNAPPKAPAPYKVPWGPRSTSICFKSSSWK